MPKPTPIPGLKRLLLQTILAPVVLMVAVAIALAIQITNLLTGFHAVERTDMAIARANEVLSLTIDMETGLRGYLVSGVADFLSPYNQSLHEIDSLNNDWKNLVQTPAELAAIQELDRRRATWLVYAARQIENRKSGGNYSDVDQLRLGKNQMDAMRSLFAQFNQGEAVVRQQQFRIAQHASLVTLITIAAVTLIAGIGLAMLSRHQLQQVVRSYDQAMKTAYELNEKLEEHVAQRTLALEQRTAELANLNKELEAFSYSISHDLRAPMRHIAGFADLLRKSRLSTIDPSDRENLVIIADTAKLAGRMVDDLLSFSRVGRTSLRTQPVALDPLVRQCLQEIAPDVKSRAIDWRVASLPAVLADASLIKMVFQNLLQNAVKYTGKAEQAVIEIGTADPAALDLLPDRNPQTIHAPAAAMVVIFIRDNGVGFDMAYAGKLFGVFQRLHRSEEFEGTGIGLANVKRIINRLGGKVWAKGELNRGATFYFSLPVV